MSLDCYLLTMRHIACKCGISYDSSVYVFVCQSCDLFWNGWMIELAVFGMSTIGQPNSGLLVVWISPEMWEYFPVTLSQIVELNHFFSFFVTLQMLSTQCDTFFVYSIWIPLSYLRTAVSKTVIISCIYTVSQKNDTDVTHYNFDADQPILIIFGRDFAETAFYQAVICHPTSPK